jgi:hypothetical protein
MKKIIFTLLCAVFASIAVNAQTVAAAQVPSAVKKAVMMKYPKASGVQWEKKQANYEAQFMLGNNWTTAAFSPAGEWLETASFIEATALPANIIASVKKEVPGAEILSATAIEKAKVGKSFMVQAATEVDTFDLTYKADGTMVSKTKVVYEDDESDQSSDY